MVKMIAEGVHRRLPAAFMLDDLISAGVAGLIKAIQDHNARSPDMRFESYVKYKIRGAILDSLRPLFRGARQQRMETRLIDAAASSGEEHSCVSSEGEGAPSLSTLIGEEDADLPEIAAAYAGQFGRSLLEDPIVQVLMSAASAFQDLETGRSWLSTPSPALGNLAPITLVSSQAGREIVANELGLMEHGMF